MALIIFDYGGVIANDLVVSWSVISDILVSYHKKPDTLPEFRNNFKLPYEKYLILKGFEEKQIPSLNIPSRYIQGYLKQISRIDTFSGVVESVRHLSKTHTLVVLSSTPRYLVSNFLDSKGIIDCFAKRYGHEDIGKEKPKPNPVLEILDEFGYDKKNAFMVGDMVQDIQSAKRAGIISIAVSNNESYHTKESLLKEKPHHIISNLTEIESIVNKYHHHK